MVLLKKIFCGNQKLKIFCYLSKRMHLLCRPHYHRIFWIACNKRFHVEFEWSGIETCENEKS